MEHESYWWLIYLVFLAIPLARIVPRILSRRARADYGARMRDTGADRVSSDGRGTGASESWGASAGTDPSANSTRTGRTPAADQRRPSGKDTGMSNEMSVMGSMHRGARTFEAIQKKTEMDAAVLERVLERLEAQKMITVVQKQGLFGVRVELHPTGKGFD